MSARHPNGFPPSSDKRDSVASNAADVAGGLYATNERLRGLVELSLRLASEPKPEAALVAELLTRAGELDAEIRERPEALYDQLTGLPNRRLFQDRLDHALHVASRRGSKLALVICDVQRFSLINETFGLQAGDALLRHVASATRAMCNDSDNIARVAPDTFAGFLAPINDAADAAHMLQRLSDAFGGGIDIEGQHLFVDVVAGVAMAPTDGADGTTLFKNAEAALRQAEASGERYLFYQPAMNAKVAETLLLENKLRQALEKQQFLLHYQPKFDLGSGVLSGIEALVRWNDPDDGLMAPSRFIPLLEQTGLMSAVGQWVITRALADHSRWHAEGLDPPRVSVNLSAIQVRQNDFVDVVADALSRGSVVPQALELELTESLLMRDIETTMQKLGDVRKMGVNIAIDDFGTGYSSLNYLAKLPVSAVKIDRSFIITMASSPESMAIVSTILSLARALRLNVVAEGVETEEQSRLLKLLRCDEAQGFLLGKPLPAADITTLLAQRPTVH